MNLKIPDHIPVSIAVDEVRYEWDEWDHSSLLGDPDEAMLEQCRALSDRAAMVFSIGCLEWVLARLHLMIKDERPYQYLTACKSCTHGVTSLPRLITMAR